MDTTKLMEQWDNAGLRPIINKLDPEHASYPNQWHGCLTYEGEFNHFYAESLELVIESMVICAEDTGAEAPHDCAGYPKHLTERMKPDLDVDLQSWLDWARKSYDKHGLVDAELFITKSKLADANATITTLRAKINGSLPTGYTMERFHGIERALADTRTEVEELETELEDTREELVHRPHNQHLIECHRKLTERTKDVNLNDQVINNLKRNRAEDELRIAELNDKIEKLKLFRSELMHSNANHELAIAGITDQCNRAEDALEVSERGRAKLKQGHSLMANINASQSSKIQDLNAENERLEERIECILEEEKHLIKIETDFAFELHEAQKEIAGLTQRLDCLRSNHAGLNDRCMGQSNELQRTRMLLLDAKDAMNTIIKPIDDYMSEPS